MPRKRGSSRGSTRASSASGAAASKKATPAARSRARSHSEGAQRQRNLSGDIPDAVPPERNATQNDHQSDSPARSASRANARELAEAVFAQVDPVNVGRDLLTGGDAKGGSVRARVWEKLLEYRYGRPPAADSADPASAGAPLCVRIISHVPRPQRDDTVEAT